MSELVSITCYGGPLDGKEMKYLADGAERARLSGDAIPVFEGELQGLYLVPLDDPLKIQFSLGCQMKSTGSLTCQSRNAGRTSLEINLVRDVK